MSAWIPSLASALLLAFASPTLCAGTELPYIPLGCHWAGITDGNFEDWLRWQTDVVNELGYIATKDPMPCYDMARNWADTNGVVLKGFGLVFVDEVGYVCEAMINCNFMAEEEAAECTNWWEGSNYPTFLVDSDMSESIPPTCVDETPRRKLQHANAKRALEGEKVVEVTREGCALVLLYEQMYPNKQSEAAKIKEKCAELNYPMEKPFSAAIQTFGLHHEHSTNAWTSNLSHPAVLLGGLIFLASGWVVMSAHARRRLQASTRTTEYDISAEEYDFAAAEQALVDQEG